MSWTVRFEPKARKDIDKLKEPTKSHVFKALEKVATNPLPQHEGGYGNPLRNLNGSELKGYLKIKLRKDGVRIVYRLARIEETMVIIVIGVRDGDYVYEEAARRIR